MMVCRGWRPPTPAAVSGVGRSWPGWWPGSVHRRSRTTGGFTSRTGFPGLETRRSAAGTLSFAQRDWGQGSRRLRADRRSRPTAPRGPHAATRPALNRPTLERVRPRYARSLASQTTGSSSLPQAISAWNCPLPPVMSGLSRLLRTPGGPRDEHNGVHAAQRGFREDEDRFTCDSSMTASSSRTASPSS
jgi:hypothetical protein